MNLFAVSQLSSDDHSSHRHHTHHDAHAVPSCLAVSFDGLMIAENYLRIVRVVFLKY